MRRNALIQFAFLWILGVLASTAHAAGATTITQLQVHASRATSSLLLLRGEGFQNAHLSRLESDIQALGSALQNVPQATDGLRQRYQLLVTELRRGVSFGPNPDDVPWRYPEDLSKALRDFLTAARAMQSPDDRGEVPAQVEYLAVQYLSRAYIGTFEIAREQPDTYLGQDERMLVPAIDAEMQALAGKGQEDVKQLLIRWNYLKAAFNDMNSQSNALVSVSGRPFAPTTVDRHSRALTEQWLRLEQ
jgi:hypothetical protein